MSDYLEWRSLFLHFESTPKVLRMSRTLLPVARMCANVWNAHRVRLFRLLKNVQGIFIPTAFRLIPGDRVLDAPQNDVKLLNGA